MQKASGRAIRNEWLSFSILNRTDLFAILIKSDREESGRDKNMDVFRMKCFMAVADLKSITKAAEYMNITQPAMSFQIKKLEDETGVKVLRRDPGGITITPAGELLRDGFAKLVESYELLLSNAQIAAKEKQRLTVGYHGPVFWAGVPGFLADFSKRHPEIEVVILQQQWKEMAAYVSNGALDAAFISSDELKENPELAYHDLFREQVCLAVSYEHPLSGYDFLTPEDIAGTTVFMNNHPSASMSSMIRRLIDSGMKEEAFRFFDQMEITLAMAAAKQGIASIPRSFKVENSVLKFIDYAPEKAWIAYSLIWRPDSRNSILKCFLEEVAAVSWPYQK